MNEIILISSIIVAAICIILLLREVQAWYFKVNARLAEQKKQTELLIKILEKL